ncbi:MAG: diadenylate cyclase, partial [Eubacteriales bacterium]|nr:diadenylate cyclase [Eubacteriales bacterium]
MMNGDLLSDIGQFFSSLLQDFTSGLIFFGGPLDIMLAVLDVLATSLVVYYVLKILRDSRAWQLLKGLAMIISFALICSLIGLDTVGFLLNNTISVLAIAFVVIFQPELRRALETVGRNSFNMISSAIAQDDSRDPAGSVHNLIEAIVRACEKMSETFTGALIIIERSTRLGDFAEQENVVPLDAAVSSTFLQQIFYKGSPLHDGA